MRRAFSMIELLMVIIILGIISTIGVDIVVSLYQDNIKEKAINRLQMQTELVLEQISRRLSNRIKRSTGVIRGGNIIDLSLANSSDNILTWIGIDKKGWLGGWSGFIDLSSPNTNPSSTPKTIHTPKSNLNEFARDTIYALSYKEIDLNSPSGDKAALIMKVPPIDDANISRYYTNTSDDYTIKVRSSTQKDVFLLSNDDVADYNGDNTSDLYEQYYLCYSAYTILTKGDPNDFTLILKYNYQPWEGETFSSSSAKTSILAEHVSTFRFMQSGGVIRIKLCIHDDKQSAEFDFSACKETVVF